MALNFYKKMNSKDLATYKKKYQIFKHHAWAGLGFLAVLLAIRVIFQQFTQILSPIIFVLIIYIVVALILTYKYRAGLSAQAEVLYPSEELEKEKIKADVEKNRLKVEKKKAKRKKPLNRNHYPCGIWQKKGEKKPKRKN